jgi:hypothetical protein
VFREDRRLEFFVDVATCYGFASLHVLRKQMTEESSILSHHTEETILFWNMKQKWVRFVERLPFLLAKSKPGVPSSARWRNNWRACRRRELSQTKTQSLAASSDLRTRRARRTSDTVRQWQLISLIIVLHLVLTNSVVVKSKVLTN